MRAALFLCVAGAFASASPRIELNLASTARTAKLAESAFRSADPYFRKDADIDFSASPTEQGNLASGGSTEVFNRQDWVQRCQVLPNSDVLTNAKCPLPVAKAWDHQDRDISEDIVTKVYYVDRDNAACDASTDAKRCEVPIDTIDYGTRGTYLIKYDVEDQAGNHAEQVVFLLEIDDRCGTDCEPTIKICGDSSEQWEAASSSKLCTDTTASDPLPEEDLTSKLEYAVHRVSTDASGAQTQGPALCRSSYADLACANKELTTSITQSPSVFVVRFHVCDNAFKYGPDGESNCVSVDKVITISDNTPPVITVLGWGAEGGTALQWECHRDASIHKSDCVKTGDHTVSGYSGTCWHGRTRSEKAVCVSKEDPDNDGSSCWGILTRAACEVNKACAWQTRTWHDSGAYHDAGAVVYDTLDTEALDRTLAFTATQSPQVDTTQIGEYMISYNAQDTAGNEATTKSRHVQVRDTLAPTVVLDGFEFVKDIHDAPDKNLHQKTSLHLSDENKPQFTDPEWSCRDACDTMDDAMKQKPQWDKPWNDRVVGDYYRTYTCMDASKNAHSAVRKFTVKDETIPVITIMGPASQTIEATRDSEYTDQGAQCHDYVDGVLSHAVEVSGEIVNMRLPGEYTVQYDCHDLSGNKAVPVHRVVTIVDTTCPEVSIKGVSPVYIEAGFDYTDAGATATDTLDGDISDRIIDDGNTVDVANAFHSSRSCREILIAASTRSQTLKSGMYFITVYRESTMSYHRRLVHCDMDTVGPDGKAVGYTYAHCGSTSKPCHTVVPYGADAGSCADMGLKMANFAGKQAACEWIKIRYPVDFPQDFDCANPTTSEASGSYLCGTNDERNPLWSRNKEFALHKNSHKTDHLFQPDQRLIAEAEAGMYVIYYHVSDSAGNTESSCGGITPSRTVIVKDTLPPVITLHLGNKLIHKSDGSQQGLRGAENPANAGVAGGGDNPNLASGYDAGAGVPNSFPSGPPEAGNSGAVAFMGAGYPKCMPHKGSVHAMCSGLSIHRWGIGPEGEAQAVKNCHYAATVQKKWGTCDSHPGFMAERASSVNAWVIGAAASAALGVALLSFSRRKQDVTVDV